MSKNSRTKKTFFNLYSGILYQVVSAILNFLIRKVFLEYISIYYLGLDGVFSNLINMMALLDFGVGTASTYYLMRAASKDDEIDLMITYHAFARLYRIIAIILSFLGLIICFNIQWFINVEGYDIIIIQISFLLTLLRTIFAFLMSCPKTLFSATQHNYYNMLANTIVTVIFFFVKIIVIKLFANFYLYLVTLLVEVTFNYFIIGLKFNKIHHEIQKPTKEQLAKKTEVILNYGKKILLLNINEFIYNSTDNLVISKVLGTITVGIISNYYMIISAVQLFALQIIDAASASISNYINDEQVNNAENTRDLITDMGFICFAMGLFCSTCLFGLTDEFIGLFFGEQFVMPKMIICFFSLNVVLMLFQAYLRVFIYGRGLATHEIVYSISMSIINLTISIIGAKTIGVSGVLLGTIIANFVMIIGRAQILHNHFQLNRKIFFLQILSYLIIVSIDFAIVKFVFPTQCTTILSFTLRVIYCVLLVAVSLLPFIKTRRFQTIKQLCYRSLHIH